MIIKAKQILVIRYHIIFSIIKLNISPKGHPNDRDSHRYNFPFKTKKGFEERIYNLYILPKYLLAIWKKKIINKKKTN